MLLFYENPQIKTAIQYNFLSTMRMEVQNREKKLLGF